MDELRVDPRSDRPIFRQIADSIAEAIRAGSLAPGTRLPATRALAQRVSTHRNTVVRAYQHLERLGLVESTVGRGTFVSAVIESPAGPPSSTDESPTHGGALPWGALIARAAEAEPLGRLDRLASTAPPAAEDPVDLVRMQPASELLPVEALRESLNRVLGELGAATLGYAPRDGLVRLREAIAARLVPRGIEITAEDVLITTGSQQALDLIARALVDPSDTFLVEASTYSGMLNCFAAAGARLCAIPSDGDGPDLEAVASRLAHGAAKGFYVMPDCHNPTGRTISVARREGLVGLADQFGLPLIEDDYAADLELDDGGGLPPLRAMSSDVVYVATFSKKLIPALRVGFVICPPALRQRLVCLKHAMDLGTSALLQNALADLIEHGELDRHLTRVRPEYRRRRDALVEGLRAHLPPGIEPWIPSRGVALWLPLPDGMSPEAVFAEARSAGVLVSPGTLHSATGRREAGVRLTYCVEPPERLKEGARRLGAVVAKLNAYSMGGNASTVNPLGVV